jgi:hypothetical protein
VVNMLKEMTKLYIKKKVEEYKYPISCVDWMVCLVLIEGR